MLMHSTPHERKEWQRMADHARGRGHLGTACRYDNAAKKMALEIAEFDHLQEDYRDWLIQDKVKV